MKDKKSWWYKLPIISWFINKPEPKTEEVKINTSDMLNAKDVLGNEPCEYGSSLCWEKPGYWKRLGRIHFIIAEKYKLDKKQYKNIKEYEEDLEKVLKFEDARLFGWGNEMVSPFAEEELKTENKNRIVE